MTVDQQYRACTQLTSHELNALREFWQVCEPRYEELVADIESDAREHPIAGTGLGLSICRKIIRAHEGEIWAESEGPGKGARFLFTLPVSTLHGS